MIAVNLYLSFALAVTLLMLVPGPNVSLIVANSVTYGPKYGLLTVAGTSSAMVIQLALTALGLTATLGVLGVWFAWLRWLGVIYLIYLGIRHWRAPLTDPKLTQLKTKDRRAIFLRALLVSLTNPKTLLFYAVFFPQFVDVNQPFGAQIALLCVTFLSLAIMIDSIWALGAGRMRPLLTAHGRLRNRVSGGFLIGAAAALALSRNG